MNQGPIAGGRTGRLKRAVEWPLLAALVGISAATALQLTFSDAAPKRHILRGGDFDAAESPPKRRAGPGERVPEGAAARLGTLRWRTGDWCSGLAYSPDAARLMSVESQQVVRVWDTSTGEQICRMAPQDETLLHLPAMSPDNTLVAIGGWTGFVYLYDADDGRLLRKLSGHRESGLRSMRREVRRQIGMPEMFYTGWSGQVQFSPEGDTLFSVGGDGCVRAWDVSNGRERWGTRGHAGGIKILAIAADGKRIATGGYDGRVRLWNAADGKIIRQVNRYEAEIQSLAFDPQRTWLDIYTWPAGTREKKLERYNLDTKAFEPAPLREGMLRANISVFPKTFSPDGRRMLERTADGEFVLTNVEGTEIQPTGIREDGTGFQCAIAGGESNRVAIGLLGQSRVFQFPADEPPHETARADHGAAIAVIVSAPGGRQLATGDNRGVLKVWDQNTWKAQYALDLGTASFPIQFTQDTRSLAVGPGAWSGEHSPWQGQATRQVEMWRFLETRSGKPHMPWDGALTEADQWWCAGALGSVQWILARHGSASEPSGLIRLACFDAGNQTILWELPTPFLELTGTNLVQNGRFLWAAGKLDANDSAATLTMWAPAAGELLWQTTLAPNQGVAGVTRGNRFVVVGRVEPITGAGAGPRGQEFQFLDFHTGEAKLTLHDVLGLPRGRWADAEDRVVALPFRWNGSALAEAAELRVIDLNSGAVKQKIPMPADGAAAGVFVSPAGDRVAAEFAPAKDQRLKQWSARLVDTATGRMLWRRRIEADRLTHPWLDLVDGDRELWSHAGDGVLERIDPKTGERLPALIGHSEGVSKCVLSADGSHLITGGHDGHVGIWRRSDGRRLRDLVGHRGPITLLTLLPNGKEIATGSSDSTVVVWPFTAPVASP